VQKVLNGDVVSHYLALDLVHLGRLFLDAFFEISQLVLERLNHLFGDLLLFYELALASVRFFAPVVELLVH
jgi:hypothetical protein